MNTSSDQAVVGGMTLLSLIDHVQVEQVARVLLQLMAAISGFLSPCLLACLGAVHYRINPVRY